MPEHQRRRCEKGNEFNHFSLKAIAAARLAKAAGHRTMTLWEHPEDLGRMQAGEPASVWQLDETRTAFGDTPFTTVAGHQCQFGIDASKPTRIYTDLAGAEAFGKTGWPTFDAAGYYTGPLPRCGHRHKQKTIGRTEDGEGFNTFPMAAYPPKMCEFLAKLIYNDWMENNVMGMRK